MIGLGAGRPDVKAEVQLYQNGLVVEQLVTDAKSGRKPGAAETMGDGAAADSLAVSAAATGGLTAADEALGSNVEADAARTAKKLAGQLEEFFVREGWISE